MKKIYLIAFLFFGLFLNFNAFAKTVSSKETITNNVFLQTTPLTAIAVVGQFNCSGTSVTINASGGVPNYQYQITSATSGIIIAPYQTSNIFNNLPAGTYSFTVRDAVATVFTGNFVIINSNPLICNTVVSGNTITTNASGGNPPYFYNFSINGSLVVVGSNPIITNIIPGVYTVFVSDTNNCQCTSTVVIYPNINITTTSTYVDFNNDGFTNLGDVVTYTFSVTNTGSSPITNLSLNSANGLTFSGGILANLNIGATDTSTFTAVHAVSQSDINDGAVNVFIQASGTSNGNIVTSQVSNTKYLTIPAGIKMNAFIDTNTNGFQDGTEQNFTSGNFNYTINGGSSTSAYSSTGIKYLYESNPTNSYNLSYIIDSSVASQYTIAISSYTTITVANGSGITTYNFALTRIPFVDLEIQTLQSGPPPRPGFTYINKILYVNNGTQTIPSGTITFVKDNTLSITNISQSGTTNTSNGFTYNFTNLLPLETRYIYVTMQVPTIPTVNLGQLVTNSSSITIPTGDINVANNTSNLTQTIVGSYDPNEKEESHGGKIVTSTFTTNDYLTYTIQFENTGTAEAINIKVVDVLDTKLEPSSIKMVDASSNYVLDRVGNTLTWKFDGINLPPSIANSTVGHGYITFQIKPKPSAIINGNSIPNSANIYFDFNPAIITNVCTTEFVSTLSNQDFAFKNFSYTPNPVTSILTISNISIIDSIEITNLLGQTILSKKINSLQSEIDLSSLLNGVYLMKVSADGSEKIVKIMKN